MRLPLPIRRHPGEGRARASRAVVLLATATVLATAATGYLWFEHSRHAAREATARGCVAAASTAAQVIFSYDYRTFDDGVARAKAYLTGDFADEYAKTTATLKATARSEQAVVQAQVSAIAVLDSTDHGAELLVYLDQYRRNTNITGEKVDQDRVVLTMVDERGSCKVAHAAAI